VYSNANPTENQCQRLYHVEAWRCVYFIISRWHCNDVSHWLSWR